MDHNRELDNIIEENGRDQQAVIPILQSVQARYNYLPEEVLKQVCEKTEITPDLILGVASFYNHFRLKPAGNTSLKSARELPAMSNGRS
jgi:NADH-quinone oxidoreductase subunit F